MAEVSEELPPRPLLWVGSSKDDLKTFPLDVRREVGFALYLAQVGTKGVNVKPLRGFGGASVLEVVERYDGNAYRAVYTVKFPDAVFVLHAFQKKSKKGIATSPADIATVKKRLKVAEQTYEQLFGGS